MGWTTTTSGSGGIGGKILFSLFGLFFAFIGSQFVKTEWQSLQETKAMQQWVPMNCTIETCTAEDYGDDFRLDLSYSYTVNGRQYTSNRYGKQHHLVRESISAIKAVEKTLVPGKTISGYHNPDDPAQAVLDLPTIGSTRSTLGMTFVFPTIGILFATVPWLRRKKKAETKTNQPAPKIFLIVFGGIFALVGSLMLKPMAIDPVQKIQRAKNWSVVPAVVVSSKVKSHDSDDGTTYSPYIAYRYELNGHEYFGDQLTFIGGSSSGYESKAAIVRQYPKGYEFQVYVNPLDPAESVINPKASAGLLFCLIPLIFTLVGIGIIIGGFRAGKGGKIKLNQEQAQEHIVVLKGTSRIGAALFITLFTIIWNGVVYLIYRSDAGLFFLAVFGFFGLVSIGLAIKTYLSLFNPRPVVEITPGNIRPGTNIALRWRLNGRVDRLNDLGIELKCLKVTTETSGHGKNRSTRCVKTPLYECGIFKSSSPLEIPQGALQCIIPADRPASRPGNHNGIEWQIVFSGDIPHWPDLKQEFRFLVYPDE
ncbi:DUF3592 domain-containing protein [Pontiellaceae bacterium B12227]|nr:DUF3592 domain-containing protein [Pontiellaceae bacterium B12227]